LAVGSNLDVSGSASIPTLSSTTASVTTSNITTANVTDLIVTGNTNIQYQLSSQSASYTLVLSDNGKVIPINSSGSAVVTVPPESSVNFPIGTSITIVQTGTGQTTLAAGIGVTVLSDASKLKIKGQYAVAGLLKTGSDTWVAFGNLIS
jgi:hypothetical protein